MINILTLFLKITADSESYLAMAAGMTDITYTDVCVRATNISERMRGMCVRGKNSESFLRYGVRLCEVFRTLQLHLQPFRPNLKAVHRLDRLMGAIGFVVRNET